MLQIRYCYSYCRIGSSISFFKKWYSGCPCSSGFRLPGIDSWFPIELVTMESISLVSLLVKWEVLIIHCYTTSYHKPSNVDQAPFSSRIWSHFQRFLRCWQNSVSWGCKTKIFSSGDCLSPRAVHRMAVSFKTSRRVCLLLPDSFGESMDPFLRDQLIKLGLKLGCSPFWLTQCYWLGA